VVDAVEEEVQGYADAVVGHDAVTNY
jgi:hypothetical protein